MRGRGPRIGQGRNWRPRLGLTLAVVDTLVAGGAPLATAEELTLSVAISMKEAIETLGRSFTARHPGLTLRYNFGASATCRSRSRPGRPSTCSSRPRPGRWTSSSRRR